MRGLRNLASLIMAWLLTIAAAGAAEPVQRFYEAVAAAYEPYREAVHYLETGNAGLAALAIERARDQWRKVEARFAASPPEAFGRDPKWRESIEAIGKVLGESLRIADTGNAEAALASLVTVRRHLGELRRRSGQQVYSDCIDAMNAAMDRLYVYRRSPPARGKPNELAQFKQAVAETEKWYRRCREEAPPAIQSEAEFRRLFDGAITALGRLSRAAQNGSDDLLISLLREIRSYDKLIWLRFG